MSDHPGPEGGAPPPPSGTYPPPPPPPGPVPPSAPGPGPRQRHPALPWVVAGVAVLLLVIVIGVVLIQGDDDASTSTDAERETTTSEPPSTTTTSESPTTTEAATAVVFPEDLKVGDCFNDSAYGTPEVGEITRTDCGPPHHAEVFALVTLPGAPDAPYPGDGEITRQGDELCRAQFAPYVGIDYLDSHWDFGFYAPIEDTWRKFDDRLVICYLGDPAFNKIEGSKRASAT
jgi:Septum formation